MSALLLKPIEVAELLGLSRSKVFEMLAAEDLPVLRIGRAVRVPRNDLDEWIRGRTRGRPEPRGLLSRVHVALSPTDWKGQ